MRSKITGDGRTDRRTDRRTDTPSLSHLKSMQFLWNEMMGVIRMSCAMKAYNCTVYAESFMVLPSRMLVRDEGTSGRVNQRLKALS